MESALIPVSAVDAQRAAELAAEERERYAMRAAHLESHMAQHMFLENVMLPQPFPPITYERGYTLRHNALVESHESMRAVHRMLARGRVSRAMQMLEEELGGVSEDGESEDPETDEPVADFNVQDVQTALLEAATAQQAPQQAPFVHAFRGRCFRLDGSAVESSSTAASVSDAPASEDSQEPHCNRCGDRENLHLMDQSGLWIDAASEAARKIGRASCRERV